MEEFTVVLIGIVAGAVGYLITTFWVQPILRYREIKYQITSDLLYYANVINAQGLNEAMQEKMWERTDRNRRHSTDLHACSMFLPWCYKWILKQRKENPEKASEMLTSLSNTFNDLNAEKLINMIKKHLRIETERV